MKSPFLPRSIRLASLTVLLAALVALAVTPQAAAAKELKPKFGDIGGVFYTEVQGDRKACEQAIKNKIALCRQNTSFVSNTEDQKYPGCLPIFRDQARTCADHFRSEAYKCQGSGSTRIEDFTGFACTVAARVVEQGEGQDGEPGVAPADRWMQARTRTNIRAGPGTDHARVGLLEAGEKVHVTGEAGDWLRIEAPGGGSAFVHGSLLVVPTLPNRDAKSRKKQLGQEAADRRWKIAEAECNAAVSRHWAAFDAFLECQALGRKRDVCIRRHPVRPSFDEALRVCCSPLRIGSHCDEYEAIARSVRN